MDRLRAYYDCKVALVTGGASGVGAGLGKGLSELGCKVILADIQGDVVKQVASEIGSRGGQAQSVVLDVCDYEAFQVVIEEILRKHGRLDFSFNNAGIAIGGYAADHTIEDWKKVIDVNLLGVVNGIQAGYPAMRKQGS
jgi:NADP-dependent 3-hydroxy acid dehydrogenase YdfG